MNSYDPWQPMLSSPPGEWPVVPAPYYDEPFISTVPSWPVPSRGERRVLFDGAFVGAALAGPADDRSELTKEVAPVVAPATGPITARVELDDRQVLHGKICVDGKCYEGHVDLAPVIASLMARFAQYHTDLHQNMRRGRHARTAVSGESVVGAIDAAVAAAGHEMIGRLVGRHVDVACSGWLSDLGSALKSAAGSVASTVSSTVSKLKGPIAAAAGIAAASGAALIPGVGPLAAPLAAKLANSIVSATAGDKEAQQQVAAAKKEAKTDPTIAAALSAAKKAAAQSTVAHHVQATAQRAARGDRRAQRRIASVVKDAEKGDPVAKTVSSLVESGFVKELSRRIKGDKAETAKVPDLFDFSKWGASEPETAKVPELFDPSKWGEAVSGIVGGPWVDIVGSVPWYTIIGAGPWFSIIGAYPWYAIVGEVADEHRQQAVKLAKAKGGDAIGVARGADGVWYAHAFASLDDADDWFGAATADPAGFTYAAYFQKSGRLFPRPEHEKLGGARMPTSPGSSIPREIARAS